MRHITFLSWGPKMWALGFGDRGPKGLSWKSLSASYQVFLACCLGNTRFAPGILVIFVISVVSVVSVWFPLTCLPGPRSPKDAPMLLTPQYGVSKDPALPVVWEQESREWGYDWQRETGGGGKRKREREIYIYIYYIYYIITYVYYGLRGLDRFVAYILVWKVVNRERMEYETCKREACFVTNDGP